VLAEIKKKKKSTLEELLSETPGMGCWQKFSNVSTLVHLLADILKRQYPGTFTTQGHWRAVFCFQTSVLFSNVSFVFKRQFCFQTSVPK
jgi:hypothetical protein